MQYLSNSLTTISYPSLLIFGGLVSDERSYIVKAVVDNGFLNMSKPLISHENTAIRRNTSWVLSNISADSLELAIATVDSGIVELLLEKLENDQFSVRKEILFVI
mmetsp:Transcript_11102/g.9834  ORF Transcript_11102/g.9834 Transcript_11102/m.9834 type:complete len:105 (-) Transcript_11102:376-690(-)